MFKGTIVAIITPFTNTGEVDYAAFKNLIDWQIAEGIDGIVCMGTTGEAPTVSSQEQEQLLKTAIDVAHKRVPIIAGTGTYDTRKTVERTIRAKELGADGCLVVVPYYNRPTPEGCIAHFHEVSKVELPTILYHHPGRTGVRLSASTIAEIAKFPSIVAVKEASGSLELIKALKAISDIPIFSGDDVWALGMMECGAVGVISIVANVIPKLWSEMARNFLEGNVEKAKEIDELCKPLYEAMILETNPQCVKYAMFLLGKCHLQLRLPLIEPRETTKLEIIRAFSKVDLKQAVPLL